MKRFILVALALAAYLPLAHTAHAQHVSSGLIAEYAFDDGTGSTTVADSSGFGTALDLTIRDPGNVTWGAGSLTIDTSTVIESAGAAVKINDAVALGGSATNALTIEAYVKPANNTQGGAARIVNIGVFGASGGPTNRNVFLAQDKKNIDARLRTTGGISSGSPHPNLNGDRPQQQTDSSGDIVNDPTELLHLVFTRDAAGASFIYVNGIVKSDPATTQPGDLSNWDPTYGLTLANEETYSDATTRDFLGEFHHVSIYDRALSGAEVIQNAESFGITVIPEPTSLVLIGLGVGLVGATRRRRTIA